MLVAVKGLLGSMFLDDPAQKTKRGQVGRVKAGRIPGGVGASHGDIHPA